MPKLKTVKRYQVRRDGEDKPSNSRAVGFKGRLLPRNRALRVISRLNKSGVPAYLSSPVEIKVPVTSQTQKGRRKLGQINASPHRILISE